MSEHDLGPGARTRVRRLPEKARYDEATIYAILDEARLCHVAGIVDGRAVALPTLHAREGRVLYLHGNRSNGFMQAVLGRGEAYVTVTIYDGLRLARSGFESSIAYRSAVVIGRANEVEEPEEKRRVLDMFVDAILPGRAAEVRPMNERELKLTLVVLDNRGFACINRLQQSVGGAPFNNLLSDTRHETLPEIDFAAHAASLGAASEKVADIAGLEAAMMRAKASERTYVIVIDTDPAISTEAGGAWWDVPVAEVSERPAVNAARAAYDDRLKAREQS